MRKAYLIVVFCLVVVAGCCPCRVAGTATTVNDSIYTARFEKVRIIIRDTMRLQAIAQSHEKNITEEQLSELSNDYCVSIAEVDSRGLLHHTLDTKDSAMLPVRIIIRDSIIRDTVFRYIDKIERQVVVKEVRKVTWWQRTQSILLWALLGILAIRYRKEILSLIRRIVLWI